MREKERWGNRVAGGERSILHQATDEDYSEKIVTKNLGAGRDKHHISNVEMKIRVYASEVSHCQINYVSESR